MLEAATPNLLTYSALTQHRQCPQAWSYRQLRGLRRDPDQMAPARDVGSWWHALRAADAIGRGAELGTLHSVPGKITTADSGPVWVRAGAAARATSGDERSLPLYARKDGTDQPAPLTPQRVVDALDQWLSGLPGEAQEEAGDMPALLAGMDARWRARWADDIAAEQPLAVEVWWEREITPGVRLGGYIDEVIFDPHRNIVVVRDDKTAKTLNTSAEEDFLDSQLHLYAWGVSPLVREWVGQPVGAIAYDRTRAAAPKEPVITQMGTLSKTVTDFDLATYLAFAETRPSYPGRKKDGSQAGVYVPEEKVIEKLSTPQALNLWTQRTRVPLNKHLIRSHLQAALDTYEAQQKTVERFNRSGEAARNLTRYGCRFCDYADLCRAEMIGGVEGDYPLEEFGLIRRTPSPHKVLTLDSA